MTPTPPDPCLPVLEDLVRRALGARIARLEPLRPGLGLRRFYRLHLERAAGAAGDPPPRAVARVDAPEDAAGRPPGVPPEPPLEPLRSLLEAAGLPVPARLAGDAGAGIEILEDVGDRSLADAFPDLDPAVRRALYERLCDLVARLQAVADPGGLEAFRRRLDAPLFRYKADLFTEHSLPLALGRAPRPAERAVVREAFDAVARRCAAAPRRLAHRDLQSANIHLVAPRGAQAGDGVPQPVWIDLQGAFLAPPEYDLVCLLRDSYVEIPESEVGAQLERVRPRLPDAPPARECAERFDLLTVTRKAKDHARYLYAARARGDRRYLAWAPRAARAVRHAAARVAGLDPALGRLAELVARLPEETPCAP